LPGGVAAEDVGVFPRAGWRPGAVSDVRLLGPAQAIWAGREAPQVTCKMALVSLVVAVSSPAACAMGKTTRAAPRRPASSQIPPSPAARGRPCPSRTYPA
jgi:hypothetical protein